jgi:hypothetical protein
MERVLNLSILKIDEQAFDYVTALSFAVKKRPKEDFRRRAIFVCESNQRQLGHLEGTASPFIAAYSPGNEICIFRGMGSSVGALEVFLSDFLTATKV